MAKARRKSTENLSTGAAAAPQAAGNTTAAAPERDRIAARAYELYLARGGTDGMALEDWLSAERELKDESPRRRPK